MPAGSIIFNAKVFAYGQLIREEIIQATGVDHVRFTDDKRSGKEDLFRVGAVGKTGERLDLMKDEAKSRGSPVGK